MKKLSWVLIVIGIILCYINQSNYNQEVEEQMAINKEMNIGDNSFSHNLLGWIGVGSFIAGFVLLGKNDLKKPA